MNGQRKGQFLKGNNNYEGVRVEDGNRQTFDGDHKVAEPNINSFWLQQKTIRRLVHLGIPSLNRIQRSLCAQGLISRVV